MNYYADTSWIRTEHDLVMVIAAIAAHPDAEFVANGDDNDSIEPSELDRLFAIVYERAPDDNDREDGLWSLICAGVDGAS